MENTLDELKQMIMKDITPNMGFGCRFNLPKIGKTGINMSRKSFINNNNKLVIGYVLEITPETDYHQQLTVFKSDDDDLPDFINKSLDCLKNIDKYVKQDEVGRLWDIDSYNNLQKFKKKELEKTEMFEKYFQ
jgi:hypothetical protein